MVVRHPRGGRAPNVAKAREQGAQVVVLLSHNGFDVDAKLAARVEGIDIILTAHTHDALPQPMRVGNTLLVASGWHGKFLSRIDVEVDGGSVKDFRYELIPLLADAIAPDPGMAALIANARAPSRTSWRPSSPAPRGCSIAAARSAARSTT